jgi:3-hydroxyacyl-CoA dehydrogenase / enoyl-CoA hydratase / 3-hydroxybutyryl-CoA epimerase
MAHETTTSPHLRVDEDGLAHVEFDDPDRSVNVLTEAVMRRLGEVVEEIGTGVEEGQIRGVIFRSGKPTFIVGADIEAIARIEGTPGGSRRCPGGPGTLSGDRAAARTDAGRDQRHLHGWRHRARTRVPVSGDVGRLDGEGRDSRGPAGDPSRRGEVRPGSLDSSDFRPALDLLLTGKTVDGRKALRLGLVEAVLPESTFDESAEDFLRARIEERSR